MPLEYCESLAELDSDGPTLTAAAAATCLNPEAKPWIRGGYFDKIGRKLRVWATGRISCVVTTPGTARFDIRYGGAVIMDSLAMPLNIVAKVNVGWTLLMEGTIRILGAVAQFWWQGWWSSEAYINTAVPATGPAPGCVQLPYNTAPALGAAFDATAPQLLDMFFTQTVATGSLTVHQCEFSCPNSHG